MRLTSETSLFAWRMQNINSQGLSKTLERLSSGLRINSAADDAAGLSISTSMRSKTRSLNQDVRNINDGVSLLQTAEGALNEISNMLVRGRELAVQAANGTVSSENRQSLQEEMDHILAEIDRIANATQFNGINLLNATTVSASDMTGIVTGLQSSWLKSSENLIQTYYGLTGDGAPLQIVLDQNPGPYLAYVSYTTDPLTGKATNQQLHVDAGDFLPPTLPNGGTAPYYDDRIIAHEMVHAVMGRTTNFASLPTWFKEGTAEFIQGADERVSSDIAANGGGAAGETAVVNAIDSWASDSLHYSSGYTAVRYMHDQIKANGGTGVKDVMTYLAADTTRTLDDAITNASSGAFANLADFITQFKAAGVAYIAGMNLANADTGAVGGLDADGGAAKDAAAAVPDLGGPATTDPLTGFTESWPTVNSAATSNLSIKVGTAANDTIDIALVAATSSDIGLSNVDLVSQAGSAIDTFDGAIQALSRERSRLGSYMNRLEHSREVVQNAYENLSASNSRILDADFATETATLTRQQILTQASLAILAQSNQTPQYALTLIKG